MNTSNKQQQDTKEVFMQCGTCSQTFGRILNREFGKSNIYAERALNPLAGGLMNSGHQCGMLWGTILGIGSESYRRNKDINQAIAVSVKTAKEIIESFTDQTETVNCKEIIGYDLSSITGLFKYMMKVTLKGMKNSQCFNLAEQWAPEAIKTAKEGLDNTIGDLDYIPVSCASVLTNKMGATDEEMVMVAGFAGGMGLSGNACGALGAAIWLKTLRWCKTHPGKLPPYFNNKDAKKTMKSFFEMTDDRILCHEITGQKFDSLKEHTEFIDNGGCKIIIDTLSEV